MHSVVKKEGSTSMNLNARNAGGERGGRNYSRGRPRRNPLTISDFMDQALVNKMSTVPTEASRRRRRRGGRNQQKPQGPRQTHIEDLNDDCLLHIISFLPIVDRVRIQRVCKHWQTISLITFQNLKELNLREDFWGVHYNKSKVIVNRHTFHQVLKLCGPFLNHVDLTKDLIGRIPRIRVESCKAVVKLIDETCPNLRSLNIGKPTSTTEIDYLADHFLKLTNLTMEVSTFDQNYEWAVEDLFSTRKNLKYLKLIMSKISTTCLLNSNFENLEELHFQYCEFKAAESILNVIDKLKALHTLSILYSYSKAVWEPEVLKALSRLTNLKKLNLELSTYIYISIDTNFICYLTNLQELTLHGYPVVNNEVLHKISRKCRNIKKLELITSNSVTDEGISYIANLPHLEYLRFNKLNSLICENLKKVSQIQYLECIECSQMKNEGFVNLIARSENIRWIKIRNCHSISEELIVKANSIASEKLYLTFDNAFISTMFVKNRHSLNKIGNRITKKFEKLCLRCYKVPVKNCTDCCNKVEVF